MNVMKIKSISMIMLSWIIVFLLVYILLEVSFVYVARYVIPIAATRHAGWMYGISGQYSKDHIYPENYVAIFGDSYAYGQGDWMLEGEHRIMPNYNAQHVLHKKIRRDVVSFGLPALDSITANNIMPSVLLRYTQAFRGKAVESPKDILIYFYEGNDVNDNVEVIERTILPAAGNNDVYNEEVFQEEILPKVVGDNLHTRLSMSPPWTDYLLFLSFASRTMIEGVGMLRDPPAPWHPPEKGSTTKIFINNRTDVLPDYIQTPALSLTASEIDQGIYIFGQSILGVRRQFPDARIGIVYLPAVITPYQVVSEKVHDYYRDAKIEGSRIQSSSRIRPNSEKICQGIRQVAIRNNLHFIDTRSELRRVAASSYIHGPVDWNHFNRLGYETIANMMANLVVRMQSGSAPQQDDCRWQ